MLLGVRVYFSVGAKRQRADPYIGPAFSPQGRPDNDGDPQPLCLGQQRKKSLVLRFHRELAAKLSLVSRQRQLREYQEPDAVFRSEPEEGQVTRHIGFDVSCFGCGLRSGDGERGHDGLGWWFAWVS